MSFEGWTNGIPPALWKRIMAFDVGGATANAMEVAAICPDTQSLVFYAEINKKTTDMRVIAELALPLMRPEGSNEEYNFLAKVGDYENKIALADMGRYGIRFTNAVKHDKLISVGRFSGYLHPNPKRPFPAWHPRAGQLGAPLVYTTPACKHLNEEIPQQKWKDASKGNSVKDELDRTVKHDALDCALYIARILPAPATIPIPKVIVQTSTRSIQSQMYWEAVAARKAEKVSDNRKPYTTNHTGGGNWKSLLGF